MTAMIARLRRQIDLAQSIGWLAALHFLQEVRLSRFEPARGYSADTVARYSRNSRLHRLLTCFPPHAAVRQRLRE
jgi:hypothetical protein